MYSLSRPVRQDFLANTSMFTAVPSNQTYSIAFSGLPGSLIGSNFGSLSGFDLALSVSHNFISDAAPSGGMVTAPCVESIANLVTLETSSWEDEEVEQLEYAFYRFPVLQPETLENSTCGDMTLFEIDWQDATSSRYFRTQSGSLLRSWVGISGESQQTLNHAKDERKCEKICFLEFFGFFPSGIAFLMPHA